MYSLSLNSVSSVRGESLQANPELNLNLDESNSELNLNLDESTPDLNLNLDDSGESLEDPGSRESRDLIYEKMVSWDYCLFNTIIFYRSELKTLKLWISRSMLNLLFYMPYTRFRPIRVLSLIGA